MDWRSFLNLDLARLLGRAPAVNAPTAPVYWWTRLWRFPGKIARGIINAGRIDDSGVPLLILRSAHNPRWTGPIYLSSRSWQRDVTLVTEHIRGLIACNVPLAPGLAAGAREELRLSDPWGRNQIGGCLSLFLSLALFACIALVIPMSLRAVASPVLGGGFLLLLFIAAYSVRDLLIDFNGRMQVFLALEHRIANGAGLSEAMASLPRFFPRHVVCLVEAGETAGTLDPAFERFNAATLRSLGAQRELRATLSYLGLLAGVQLVVGMYLLVKVVPAFQEIRIEIAQSSGMADAAGDFVSSAGPVPAALLPSIGGLMEWSNGLYFSKPVASLILWPFITWVMFRHFNRARSWSARFSSSLLLMLPWFRGLIVRHNLGQVAFMLQGLLAAGVPLERALGMVGVADLHPAYLRWIGTLRARVCQGESLKEALRRTAPRGLLPESFVGLMEAGERSGQLPETLARIAELYRRDTEQRLGTLQALVLPAGILFLGYLVMATQVSIFRMMNDMAALLNV